MGEEAWDMALLETHSRRQASQAAVSPRGGEGDACSQSG